MVNALGELGAGGGRGPAAGQDAVVQDIRKREAEREARRENKRAAGTQMSDEMKSQLDIILRDFPAVMAK